MEKRRRTAVRRTIPPRDGTQIDADLTRRRRGIAEKGRSSMETSRDSYFVRALPMTTQCDGNRQKVTRTIQPDPIGHPPVSTLLKLKEMGEIRILKANLTFLPTSLSIFT